MEVVKQLVEGDGYCNFYLKEENQLLTILFGGNLDLYWILYTYPKANIDTKPDYKKEISETIVITKENYFIYSLFEELFEDIKNARIFLPINKQTTEYDGIDEEEDFDIWKSMSKEELDKQNQKFKHKDYYQKLFTGERIIWYSDDEEYTQANIVKIKKEEDSFELEFTRQKIVTDSIAYRPLDSISIRFRNSGSRYDPFNVIFMRMFNKLQDYDPNYHQLHIEELVYKRTLKK